MSFSRPTWRLTNCFSVTRPDVSDLEIHGSAVSPSGELSFFRYVISVWWFSSSSRSCYCFSDFRFSLSAWRATYSVMLESRHLSNVQFLTHLTCSLRYNNFILPVLSSAMLISSMKNKGQYVYLSLTMHQSIPSLLKTNKLGCRTDRDRAMLHVIEYFAKSLEIIQGHLKRVRHVQVPVSIPLWLYCVSPTVSERYSASNNGVTLKSGLRIIQSHAKCHLDRRYELLLAFHSNYGHILYNFRGKAR